MIFFAYIGFDAVSTAAQEAKNPQTDMPIGILGSLVICTILYILVSGLLTGIVPYSALNVADPVAVGIDATGVRWGSILVKLGAIAGLGSVMLVMLLGQSRVFYSMSRDGLLPAMGGRGASQVPHAVDLVHHGRNFRGDFRGPGAHWHSGRTGEHRNAAGLRDRVRGSLGAARTPPDLHRPFKTPLVPLVPILGIVISFALMASLPFDTWLRLFIWLVIGMAIYFGYGRHHSRVQQLRCRGRKGRRRLSGRRGFERLCIRARLSVGPTRHRTH